MRLQRALVDLQTRMRLRTTGSKDDVRQSYLSALLPVLVDPLLDAGQEGISGVIDAMDEYYLQPEDRDTVIELELGDARREDRLKKLPAPVKSAFTRTYNARSQYVFARYNLTQPGGICARSSCGNSQGAVGPRRRRTGQRRGLRGTSRANLC
jgi:hypothetical protein